MKKISIYFLLFCMGLMVVSCVEPLTPQLVLPGGSYEINLSAICTSPNTKADEPQYPILVPGVDELNENKISHIDYFVYKNGTNTPVAHGRVSESSVVISMVEAVGTASGISGTVYVIANLPDDQFQHDSQKGILKKTASGWSSDGALTKDALELLEVVASFSTLGEDGKFKKQEDFVMSGETTYELTTSAPKQTVTTKLTRLAAKLTLDLSVVPAIDEILTLPNGDAMYTQTWYPVLDEIDVYLSYADKHATLKGTPETYVAANFFTYNREGFKPRYSYTGTTDTTATVPSVTPVWSNENWKWSVTGSPFYTYPIEWGTEESTAPFIKIILPWAPYNESAGIVETEGADGYNHFVRAGRERKEETRKGPNQEFYYKVALPSKTLNGKKLQLTRNDWYNLVLDVAILGGTSDDLPLEVAGQYYVVDWNEPSFTAGGALMQGRYLDVARDTFYIYGGDGIVIPVSSSHNLVIGNTDTRITSAQRWNAKSTATDKWENINRGSVEVNGRSSVTFTNELNTEMNSSLDCYKMKFDVTISNGQTGLEKKITIIQYPAIYIDSETGGNAMVDGYYGNVNGNWRRYKSSANGGKSIASGTSSTTGENSKTYTPYAPITQNATKMKQLTIVSISSLGDNPSYTRPRAEDITGSQATPFNYLIADPRESSNFGASDLIAHYKEGTGGGEVAWTTNEASKILVGNRSVVNYIAPKLLVASRWSRMVNWDDHNFDNDYLTAQKRCATYQEAGYPAGRWRLPTEAEIMFMVNLQKYQKTDDLFTTGWSITASGSVIRVDDDNNRTVHYRSTVGSLSRLQNQNTPSCRCVYDLWYWGDQPAEGAMSTYTIMP